MGILSESEINAIPDFRMRNILLKMRAQLDLHNQATGTNWLAPTNSPQQPASAPPAKPEISVTGANGIFTVTVTPAKESVNKIIWIEVSYSTKPSFTESLTILPATQSPSMVIPNPGVTRYFRARTSYDKNNWSPYAYA